MANYGSGISTTNQIYGQAGIYHGGLASGAPTLQQSAEAPKTLASAVSRMDNLNGRLAKVIEALGGIAAQIGSAYPAKAPESGNAQAGSSGTIYRLNDLASDAHTEVSDIENLIAGIQRSLG